MHGKIVSGFQKIEVFQKFSKYDKRVGYKFQSDSKIVNFSKFFVRNCLICLVCKSM